MPTHQYQISGDQIASFGTISGAGNGSDRVVTLDNVSALGTVSDVYYIRITTQRSGDTEFENGHYVVVYDADNNFVFSVNNVQPDAQQGLAAGDEHIIFGNEGYVIDLGGFSPGAQQKQYSNADEAADPNAGDNDGEFDFADFAPNAPPCFASGSLIETPTGARRVQDVAIGDVVLTATHGPQPVLWHGVRHCNLAGVNAPDRPICFDRDALGPGVPSAPLRLSPQHKVAAGLKAGHGQCLIPAKAMTCLDGVGIDRVAASVTYHAFLLPSHAICIVNSVDCESFYPGDFIMGTLGAADRAVILGHFPFLHFGGAVGYGPPVYPVKKVGDARRFLRDRAQPLPQVA